ncbi:hypothetical protein OIU84_013836 [Salix udensis]|uniref:Uncharacterized protein n=1 Tax=Salix udensis TaxID=889485 RepID=A0AAD6JKZ1_9ROSI|nr:hypothetical protein OIU84_013836 [Salix udensis]
MGARISIEGEAINFDNVGKSPVHQLISAMSAKNTYAETATQILWVGDMIKEKIVICENDDDKHSQYVKKQEVQSSGGIGIVLVDKKTRGFADNFMEFPMTVTSSKDAAEVPDIAAPGADMVAAWSNPSWSPSAIKSAMLTRGEKICNNQH